MNIRIASPDDTEELLEIYAPYVTDTAVSFEYTVPSAENFRKRIESTLREYPYLVAEKSGKITGYAYSGAFHSREAYKHSAELSIYVKKEFHGKGIGRSLYLKLEEILSAQNIFTACACIAVPDGEDEYLTNASRLFHENVGYHTVGKHEKCGYKFGKWYSMIWMEKEIKERVPNPEPFIPFTEIKDRFF